MTSCRKFIWNPGSREPGISTKKIDIFKFQKILKFLLHVDNDILHGYENFQPEMFCIPPYTKKTNLENFELCTIHTSDPEICHFCVGRNTKYFGLKFFTAMQYVMIYAYDFFHIFLKHKNVVFKFFKIPGSLEPGSQNTALKTTLSIGSVMN